MNVDRLKELAAGFACGELETPERAELDALLNQAPDPLRMEAAKVIDAAALVSLALPAGSPSPALKEKILSQAGRPSATPEMFQFVFKSDAGWMPLRVPGAYFKLLSFQKEKGFATVLGKLDPGTSYPPHHHIGPEQIYVLQGDLRIGGTVLHAGDFHAAAAGSNHGENSSEHGCLILAVVSAEDLLALMPKS